MDYKVVLDSSGELVPEIAGSDQFVNVPLILHIGEEDIVDDGSLSQIDLVRKIAASPTSPRSACPSPEAFREAFDCDADRVYAVTLSAHLSGSYQSAIVGMRMLQEERPDVKVHVFNSCSASIGETLVALKIKELEEAGLPFEEVVQRTEDYIKEKKTLFVLDNLDTLRKNGRLSAMKALAANILKIKLVCIGTEDGTIAELGQTRGIAKALARMCDFIVENTANAEKKILGISFCNCPERMEQVKQSIISRLPVRSVVTVPTGGLSSLYANDGGVIVVI